MSLLLILMENPYGLSSIDLDITDDNRIPIAHLFEYLIAMKQHTECVRAVLELFLIRQREFSKRMRNILHDME